LYYTENIDISIEIVKKLILTEPKYENKFDNEKKEEVKAKKEDPNFKYTNEDIKVKLFYNK
jgi:hypothetical protein